jgi:acylphosphatase
MKCVKFILLPTGSEPLSRFSVMQVAYSCGVQGCVSKGSHKALLIEAEGSDVQVSEFLKSLSGWSFWIKAQIVEVVETGVKHYKGFNII